MGLCHSAKQFLQVVIAAVLILAVAPARAGVFTVVNTADAGAGSLRAAIDAANSLPGPHTIEFAIPMADPGFVPGPPAHWRIALLSALPPLSRPITIDGWSQRTPAGPGLPLIELDGSAVPNGDGLCLMAPECQVRGLAIGNFPALGLVITGATTVDCWVYACHIGVDVAGLSARPNAGDGVHLRKGAFRNLIGTDGNGNLDAEERCIISGNGGAGVRAFQSGPNNTVAGNFIGTNIAGLGAVPNQGGGVVIDGAERTRIGTNSTDDPFDGNERNVISGNIGAGVFIDGTPSGGSIVSGNIIGADATGAAPLPNTGDGVFVNNSPLVGEHRIGTIPGPNRPPTQANIIAFNGRAGVLIAGGVNTSILGNSIYDNGELGIDLAPGGVRGVTLNDPLDADTGPNNLQNFPIIINVTQSGQVSYVLNSEPNKAFVVEFYLNRLPDPSDLGEGEIFIGEHNTFTNPMGSTGVQVFAFDPALHPNHVWLTATATELPPLLTGVTRGGPTALANSTSEFSVAFPLNFAPVALPQTVDTFRDTDVTITLEGTDPENDPLSATITTLPGLGTLLQFGTLDPILAVPTPVADPLNRVVFRPLPGEVGSPYTTFQFRVSDGMTPSAPATVTVNVLERNLPPVALDDAYATDEDVTLNVPAPGVLANDIDPEMDPMQALLVSVPTNAAAFIFNADGSFTYTPSANFNGIDTFTYRARDDGGELSNVATVTITVNPVNDPPVALDDAYATDEDVTLNVPALTGVLANDTDIDGDLLTAMLVSPPTNALAFTLNPDGSFTYTPAPNFNGLDSFTYRAFDGQATSNVATARITVNPVNDPPVALDDAYMTDEDVTLNVPALTGVLANDTDVDGDILTAQLLSGPSSALAFSLGADGSFMYTPVPDFNGLDSFTYRAFDGQAFSNVATVVITVNPVNDPPVALCRDVVIDARTECPSLFITVDQVDNGSFDPEDGFNIDRQVSFLGPFPIGDTQVTLTVTDSGGLSDSCIATVTVLAEDCQPNGIPDSCEVAGGEPDCNGNLIPDLCECFWDNGAPPLDGTAANGQLSHLGGGAPLGAKAADDFYLLPGQVHRINGFTGYLLTNSISPLRRAKVEFYEDCNGAPAGEPIAVFDNSEVIAVTPSLNGFDLITIFFDLCEDGFWLEGGRSYWVSFYGLSDNQMTDLSFWAIDEQSGPHALAGLPPVKAEGIPTPNWGDFDFGPWEPVEECCVGCVNLAFSLRGESCKIIWDNGPVDLGQGRGGSPSGANRSRTSRTADNFVVAPCEDEVVCLIQAWIWTNCDPVHGFIEIYDNDCKLPFNTPLLSAPPTRVIATGETVVIENALFQGFCLELETPGWVLQAGKNYWLSAGAHSTGNFATRAFFANAAPPCDGCDQPRITPGVKRDTSPAPSDWSLTTRDYAFRIAVKQDQLPPPVMGTPPGGGASCVADADGSGTLGVEDIFLFLSAWFAGCP